MSNEIPKSKWDQVMRQAEKAHKPDNHPTDKRKLKGWLNKEDLTDKEKKTLINLWDTVLLWSGYHGYYRMNELGFQLGVANRTVKYRLDRFKKLFPDAYERLAEDRALSRRVINRHVDAIKNPISWDALDPNLRENWVKEKF